MCLLSKTLRAVDKDTLCEVQLADIIGQFAEYDQDTAAQMYIAKTLVKKSAYFTGSTSTEMRRQVGERNVHLEVTWFIGKFVAVEDGKETFGTVLFGGKTLQDVFPAVYQLFREQIDILEACPLCGDLTTIQFCRACLRTRGTNCKACDCPFGKIKGGYHKLCKRK